MKKTTITLITILIWTVGAFAQDSTTTKSKSSDMQTLLGPKSSFGGYGAYSSSIANPIDEQYVFRVGGYAAAVFNHNLSIGFGGFGYSNDISNFYNDSVGYMQGGYGGLLIEPIIFAKKAVHISFPVLIGGGSNSQRGRYSDTLSYDQLWASHSFKNFMFIEPGINLELSLTKFMRIGASAKFMYTTPISSKTTVNILEGVNYGFTMKFGWF